MPKIINKTLTRKNQENSFVCFGESYLANHIEKFLPDRMKSYRVGVLRVSTGYNFFYKNLLVKVSELVLTYRVIHIRNVY